MEAPPSILQSGQQSCLKRSVWRDELARGCRAGCHVLSGVTRLAVKGPERQALVAEEGGRQRRVEAPRCNGDERAAAGRSEGAYSGVPVVGP